MPNCDTSCEYKFQLKDALLGLQFLFVAFGALVLVPILTGLDASVALFSAGIGTLAFQLLMKILGKNTIPPIFLASSFAFISPISIGVQKWGIASTMSGLVGAGVFYILFSFLIRFLGKNFLNRLLPPTVIAPVIMSIGLILAPSAVNMAMGKSGDGTVVLINETTALIIAFSTLATVILISILGKGLFKLIPILAGIMVGYTMSWGFGILEFSALHQADWFSVPNFTLPKLNWSAVLFILPIAIAPAVEHIGDMLAISQVTGKNYLEKPGLHNTLLGDGVATILASMVGGPPNTTYSEVTGAVSVTKAFNPAIMTWSGIFAIVLAFIGKIGAILATIPVPVMGGIMLLLFGIITVVGIKTLASSEVDLNCPRNLAIVAVILVLGIGGMEFKFDDVAFSGIGLGAIVGIILNLILPKVPTKNNH